MRSFMPEGVDAAMVLRAAPVWPRLQHSTIFRAYACFLPYTTERQLQAPGSVGDVDVEFHLNNSGGLVQYELLSNQCKGEDSQGSDDSLVELLDESDLTRPH